MVHKSIQAIKQLIIVMLSMSGITPGSMALVRIVLMTASILFATFLLPGLSSTGFAIQYFACSTILYIGFIFLMLPQNGFRIYWIKKYGEEKAYSIFEGVLALGFFHNALGLTHISQSTATSFLWDNIHPIAIYVATGLLFSIGMIVKIWSALVLGIPLYYWKDMFLGRTIKSFVAKGPYKYLSNPMYGVGQLQVYAIALYYGSYYGLLCAILNQLLLFIFYYTVEYQFVKRVYISPLLHKL